MIVPVLRGRNGNNTQTNTTTSSGVVPVLQGGTASKVVPVHTQASALSVQKLQPQQQNPFQQFIGSVYNGVVGEVGSLLHPQPKPVTPKFQATQTPKLPMGMKLSLTSPQSNQSAQTKTTQQSLKQQQQTSKNVTNVVNTVGKTFPQTSQLFNELNIDPANFKSNPKKTLTDAVNTFKDAWKQESTAFNDWAKQPVNTKGKGSTQSFNKGANLVTKTANLAFSPVSAVFNAANDVPVLGSLSKLLNLGFSAVGESGQNVAISALDHVPSNVLSTKQKNDVRQAVGEIGALAAQLATGKITEIAPKTRFQLISKYGAEDAKVIVSKAEEAAKSQTVEAGTHTPQELRDQVFQKGIENTDHGKKMLATSIYAEQQGHNITISKPTLTKFDTPEVLKAREEQQQMESTHTIDTPERVQLRKQIEDKLYGEGAKNKNKRIDIVMGLPAAGKSTTLADPLARQHGSLVIDADQVKAQLPEYQGGKGAHATHVESSDVAEKGLLKRAAKNGDNIVLPLVGKNLEKMQSYVDDFKQLGYDVNLHLNDVSPETAAKRAVDRFNKTGRFVDPHYILNDVGLKPRQNYDILKMRKDITSHGKYSNEGTKPQFLEGSSNYEQPVRSGSDQGAQHQPNTERANSGTETSEVTPKVSKIAKDIEAKAVEKGFSDRGFDKLAGYTPQTFKEQAKLTTDLINNHFDDFKAIIRGEKPLPKEINPSHLITAAEEYLKNNPEDTQTLQELAKSDIVTRTSEAAQTLGAARTREAYSPIELIKQLQDDRKATIQKRLGEPVEKAVQKEVDNIKKVQTRIKKPDRYDWNNFINSIQC